MKGKTKYKFSIIIPTYNREKSLKITLEALVNQTFSNFEVLICDDGSTDNTEQVVKIYRNFLTIKYIREPNWGGPARPRNKGIKFASGEWICFLDSDDWYSDNRLEYLSKMDLSEYDFIYHDLEIMKNNKNIGKITSRILKGNNQAFDLMSNLNAIPTSSTCIRKNLLVNCDGFLERKDLIGVEDYEFWVRLAKNGCRFKYLPKSMGYYLIGDDNITHEDDRQIKRFEILYDIFFKDEQNEKRKNRIRAAYYYNKGYISFISGKKKQGLHFALKALLNGTFYLKMKSFLLFRFFWKKNNNV